MKVIKEFEINPSNKTQINLPTGYIVLSVELKKNKPCLFVLVDPYNKYEIVTFQICVSNKNIRDGWGYVGTFQGTDGNYYHLFKKD